MKKIEKKIFKIYMIVIFILVCTIGTSAIAYAADDPIAVINNLSDFIFGALRAVGMIVLGYSVFQIGMSFKSQDPSQRASGVVAFVGGVIMTFSKEIINAIV